MTPEIAHIQVGRLHNLMVYGYKVMHILIIFHQQVDF